MALVNTRPIFESSVSLAIAVYRYRCDAFACCASEQALTSEIAVLMLYDKESGKWDDKGETTLQICQNISDNTFRIVGSKDNGQVSRSALKMRA